MILHVPHASRVIPDDLRASFLLSESELEQELLCMTDAFTDDLFQPPDECFTAVLFPVSRLVVDPERFPDDEQETMAARGMGVVYTRTSRGEPLRRPPTAAKRLELMERFYKPHHALLQTAVEAELKRTGYCLIVDCHSFPSEPLPCEPDQDPDRPDICIGTDAFHTPAPLRELVCDQFRKAGFTVAVDRPYAGALVPAAFYRRDPRVASIMIELNRGLYMDESTGARTDRYDEIKSALDGISMRLADYIKARAK